MEITYMFCDYERCRARTTRPVIEKWTTVFVGKDCTEIEHARG